MSEHMFRYSRTARIDASQQTTSNHVELHEDGVVVVEIMVQYVSLRRRLQPHPTLNERPDQRMWNALEKRTVLPPSINV
jgi:hypothetical protein